MNDWTVPSVLYWVESTGLSKAIREGGLPYPIIGGLHLLSLALFGGMLLVTDLRLLGLVMRSQPFSEVWNQFRPWKQFGFVMVVATGILLTLSEITRLYRSPSFWIKMTFFALVGVHALVFRPSVYSHPEKLDAGITARAKLAAVLSIVLWVGLIVSGRMIAFDASFDGDPIHAPKESQPRGHAPER